MNFEFATVICHATRQIVFRARPSVIYWIYGSAYK